jgi:hypothetical protein
MGDGHHVWAAAEWLLAVRDALVREETRDETREETGRLVLGTGLDPEWLGGEGEGLAFGPAPTPWGPVRVRFVPRGGEVEVTWSGDWRAEPPRVEVRLPGRSTHAAGTGDGSIRVPPPAAELLDSVDPVGAVGEEAAGHPAGAV